MRDGVGEELEEMKTIRKNYPVAALQINDIISVIQNEFHFTNISIYFFSYTYYKYDLYNKPPFKIMLM